MLQVMGFSNNNPDVSFLPFMPGQVHDKVKVEVHKVMVTVQFIKGFVLNKCQYICSVVRVNNDYQILCTHQSQCQRNQFTPGNTLLPSWQWRNVPRSKPITRVEQGSFTTMVDSMVPGLSKITRCVQVEVFNDYGKSSIIH